MKFLLLVSLVALSMSVPLEEPISLGADITQFNFVSENEKGIASKVQNYGLWPGGRVPYYFNGNDFSEADKQTIMAGMKMIEDSTRTARGDCIKFVPKSFLDINYIRIINGQGGCLSEVGKRSWISGGQDVSLQIPGCVFPGVAAHELMHALGFDHEQNRPDRDQYIRVHWNNIYPKYHYAFYKAQNPNTLGFGYDYYSIMQYDSKAFSMNGGITMESINPPGVQLTSAAWKRLTNTDVGEIRQLYGCS